MNCNTTHYRANSSSVPGDPTAITPSPALPIDNGVTFRLKFNKPIDITSYATGNGGVATLEQIAAPGGAVVAPITPSLNLDLVDPSTLILAPMGTAIAPSSFYRITISGTRDTETPPNVQKAAQIFEYSSVDKVPPVVTIVSPLPAGTPLIAGSTYVIKASIADLGTNLPSKDIAYVDWFTTDGTTDTNVARVRTAPDYGYLFAVPANVTKVTLKASATDLSQNQSALASYTWDVTPNLPPQNVTLTPSVTGVYLNGHVDAGISFSDEGTVATINVTATGQHADGSSYPLPDAAFKPSPNPQVTRPGTSSPWPVPVTVGIDLPSDLKEGTTLHLTATVTDSDAQKTLAQADVNVLVDNQPPVIVSLDPKAETPYKYTTGSANTFPIVVVVKDAESGVARVHLDYDTHSLDMTRGAYDAATGQWTFTATGLIAAKNADTRIHIVATAYDYHGNTTPASADVIFRSVNDGTLPVAQWVTPVDGGALPADTNVSLTLRVHATDDVRVEKVAFTGSAFTAPGVLTSPSKAGDLYEQVVTFTTPHAGTPLTITATVSDSDPTHDVVLPITLDVVPFDTATGDANLTGDAAIDASNTASYANHTLIVSGSGTDVFIKAPLTLKNLIVLNGGHVGNPDGVKLDLTVTDHVFVDGDSSIDVTGKGYLGAWQQNDAGTATNNSPQGQTLGGTTTGGALSSSASSAGLGANNGALNPANTTYGLLTNPTDFGAGGGGSAACCTVGGNGGGAVLLHGDTARVALAGVVRADGGTGLCGSPCAVGAGAGGSVSITASQLITGYAARVTANGGDDDALANAASGAGGGRVAVRATNRLDLDPSVPVIQARGGRNGAGQEGANYIDGGAGTVFLARPGATNGELIVSANDERFPGSTHQALGTPLTGTLTFDAITIGPRALARFDNDYTIPLPAALSVDPTAMVLLPTDQPQLTMTTVPVAGGSLVQGGALAVTYSATAKDGIGFVRLPLSSAASETIDYTTTYPAAITNKQTLLTVAPTAAPGNTTLHLHAETRSGRTVDTAVSTYNIVANAAPQIIQFDVTPSSLQASAGHPITVIAAASDDVAVTSLNLSATAGFAVTPQAPVVTGATTTRVFSIDVPPATAGGTTIDLTLSSSDGFPGRAATTQTKRVTILADTTLPAVTITGPDAGKTFDVSSNVTIPIRAVVTDDVAVKTVWATIGAGAIIPMVPDPSVPNGFKADAAVPPVDGTNIVAEDLVVFATDYANNPGKDTRSINIHPIFDPNGATVSWLCPSSGALFPSAYNATLRVVAVPATSDNGVTSVVFYVGSSQTPVVATSAGSNVYEVTTALPSGSDGTPVPITVVATTIRNNVTQSGILVTLVSGLQVSATKAILEGDTQYDGKTLIVTGGTTTIDGPHTFTRLVVLDGATVTHTAADLGGSKSLDIQVTGGVYVSCGGTIDAGGKGYQDAVGGSGRTWPNTTTGGSSGTSAGSHGGEGGHGGDPLATPYGSIIDPNEPGGAGGFGSSNFTGSQGGGIIRIAGASSIVVDGSIAADGEYGGIIGSEGGAGGSIRLDATSVGGSGSIHANGASTGFSNGGGGGRVALYFQSLTMPRASVAASGGQGYFAGEDGGAGTVYLRQVDLSGTKVADELRVTNNVPRETSLTPLPSLGTGTVTTVSGTTVTLSSAVPEFVGGSQIDFLDPSGQILGTSLIGSRGPDGTSVILQSAPAVSVVAGTAYRGAWAFDQITILGHALLQAATVRPALVTTDATGLLSAAEVRGGNFTLHGRAQTQLIDVTTATIENNSSLSHPPNATATLSRLVINAGTMNIDATSSIDVSGKGYQDVVNGFARTWPFTFTGGSYQSSGGSHGGEGGHGGDPYAATYGSLFDPNEPGGAGAEGGTAIANQGGGIVRIKAQTLNVDGTILANGVWGGIVGAAAGAGGSVRIDAGTLTGAGAIHADGGTSGGFSTFGGGGGRVAIYTTNMTLPRASVTAAGGPNGAAAGTVLFRSGAQLYGDLVVDNAGHATTAKTTITAVGINPITSSTPASVTNAASHFDAPNSLSGIDLILGSDLSKSWPITGNDGTTITVAPDASFTPQTGGTFRGLYRLDSLKARYATVQLNDVLQLVSGGPDVDSTSSVVSGNTGAPVIDVTKFSFSGATLIAAAGAIVDPDVPITVTVSNQRTGLSSSISIANGAPFTMSLYGSLGDSIAVRAHDGHAFPLDSGDVVVGTLPVAAGIAAVTPQPSTVAGGASTTVTVTLDQAAPAGGSVVALTSSNPSVAPVPPA